MDKPIGSLDILSMVAISTQLVSNIFAIPPAYFI